MTQKEILKVIELKTTKLEELDYDKKHATAWLKKHPIFVKDLDAQIVANQYLNELKDEKRITSLDTKRGILLGTIDIKDKFGKTKSVYADILSENLQVERVRWWGAVPKENRTMQTLPILRECDFRGEWNTWVAPDGSEWPNFDVDVIIPSKKKAISPDELKFNGYSMINPDTEAEELMEGRNMAVVYGSISVINPYQEKTWNEELRQFDFSADHPFLLNQNLCLTMGIRVNQDIYVRAHFPEQLLGWPTWSINNDFTKINGIKQVLAQMPVNAEKKDDRKAIHQLLQQHNTVESIFKGFGACLVGEIKVNRVENVNETRMFIDIFPTFIAIKSIDKIVSTPTIQATLEESVPEVEPEDQVYEPEEEKIVIPPVPTGFTPEKLIYEAVNQFGSSGESLAKSKLKELKAQYNRLSIPVKEETVVKQAAKELNIDMLGYEKREAKEKPEEEEKPLLFEAGKIIELIQKQSDIKDYVEIRKRIEAKKEELGFFVNDTAAAHIVAKDLGVDTKPLQKSGSPIRGTGEDVFDIPLEKPKPEPPKKKTPPRKRKATELKWASHFKYINGVLASVKDLPIDAEGSPITDFTVLPEPVWEILLETGYTFEPKKGVTKFTADNLQLDAKTKKALHQFFNTNPDIQLQPPAIEDVEKAIREKLAQLKKVLPDSTPEHLKPMLASSNLDAPLELIAKIWKSL